ncbi:MAG: PQQ-binding-like beta-propeller repeat protein, partial [Deltaproteobacteria bacterium]|nr:PQQ-binding-like beta-propeller repeat protein [Deltaproteobacteria bacterium]
MCANYDADPCLEWGVIDTCGADEKCVNGQCVEDCKDECEPQGSQICQDDGYRVCGNSDGDSCLEWGTVIPCDANETCSAGVCSEDCIDECDVDERECFGSGWRQCGESGDGDSCRDWLAVTPCEEWEICSEETAQCVDNCPTECTQGEKRCTNNTVELCANHDADPCLEWGLIDTCVEGEICDPLDPACVDDCINECVNTGDKQCADEDTYETCGNWDQDSCLEWGDATDCTSGWVCSNGICEETCQDECTTDSPPITVCEGTIGWRVCDYLDADECLDLGDINYCTGSEECQAATGTCEPICEDECEVGERYCDGNDVMICADFDGDPCVEMGAMTTCSGGTLCYKGNCVNDTAPSKVLINEILYDDDGTDGEEVYIELWGEEGLSLDNYSVVGINGSNGEEYVRFDLDGLELPPGGYFVIAHPSTVFDPDWYDVLDSIADLQQGPDSVIVQWAGQVTVDAVGYPGTGAGSIPVVEGSPAPNAAYDSGDEIMYCLSRVAQPDMAIKDTDDNSVDFLKRTMCTPRWGGPGEILWEKMIYGGISTPALDIDNNYIYTVDSWGWPLKVDGGHPGNHDILFNDPLPDSARGLSSMALSWDNASAYVGSSNGVYAFDPVLSDLNGLVMKWGPVAEGCEVYSTPNADPVSVPFDGWIYFGAIGDSESVTCPTHRFVAVDSSGVEQWVYPTNGAVFSSPLRVLGGSGEDHVVFGEDVDVSGNGRIVCLDAYDGSFVWEYPVTGAGCWSSPGLGSDGETVYIGCDDGMLYAIDGVLGTIKTGFPVPVHDTVNATEFYVDGCSPTLAPGSDGMDFIF